MTKNLQRCLLSLFMAKVKRNFPLIAATPSFKRRSAREIEQYFTSSLVFLPRNSILKIHFEVLLLGSFLEWKTNPRSGVKK